MGTDDQLICGKILNSCQMMQLAEERYGKKDANFNILEYRIQGPDSCVQFVDDHTIYIQLGDNCRNDPKLAHYQLAHETVHLLSPVERRFATVLEEGVATRFGWDFLVHYYVKWGWPGPIGNWAGGTGCKKYNDAMHLADKLSDQWQDAIRCLRETEPSISKISPEMIRSKFPSLSPEDIKVLCTPFVDWKDAMGPK